MSTRKLFPLLLAILAACGGSPTTTTPPPTATVASVVVNPTTLSLVPGQGGTLTATPKDAAGATVSGKTIAWSSDVAAVATVNNAGVVTAQSAGTANISAAVDGKSGTVAVTVTEGGYIGSAGGTITAMSGSVILVLPAGAVATGTVFGVEVASGMPANSRLLAGTGFTITPGTAFSPSAMLRLRYSGSLGAGVVVPQLRIGRLAGSAWTELPVAGVDQAGRLVSASVTSGGTFAIFLPPPSMRGYAQQRGFKIGAAIDPTRWATDAQFAAVLGAEFNSVVPENALKWDALHPQQATYNFAPGDQMIDLAVAQGMEVRGHVLLWHSQLPSWLTAGTWTRTTLLAVLKGHIESVVGHWRGKIASWDVVNEVLADDGSGLRPTIWTTNIGPDVIDSAFAWARRTDPDAKLYLNDYSIEGPGPKYDALLALLTRLQNAGIPLDGVGLQAHFTLTPPSRAQLDGVLSAIAARNLDSRYTELDVRVPDGSPTSALDVQATVYGAAMGACLAQGRCRGVTTWGLTDKLSWIPAVFAGFGRALPFDVNYVPKPAYVTLLGLLGTGLSP